VSKSLALAVALAVALPGLSSAHDYSGDMLCRVTESDGQRSAWSFAQNTVGSEMSTFVETSYQGHGKSVVSQPGARPVWIMTANRMGGVNLMSQSNPGWSLVVSNVERSGPMAIGGEASLIHNGALVGVGQCGRRTLPRAAAIGDVAPE
jgi:hypothetical protein